MRRRRLIVGLVVGFLLAGCGSPSPTPAAGTSRSPGPEASSEVSEPGGSDAPTAAPTIDPAPLLGTGQALAVPDVPQAAAAYLAGAVRNPAIALAATRELLLRSGIGIFRADSGALAAMPADPSLVDAYLYDFELPLLADAVASNATLSLSALVDLLVGAGAMPEGSIAADLEPSVRAWLDASATHADGPLAFAGLAVGALMAADGAPAPPRGTADAEAGEASAIRLDPLAFQLALASLLSGVGSFDGGQAAVPSVRLASIGRDATPSRPANGGGVACQENASRYNSGLEDWALKEGIKLGLKPIGADGLAKAHSWAKLLGTAQARAALLAGLTLTVRSDAVTWPHYRHSSSDEAPGKNAWTFTATARFETDLGGQIVTCGPLAGLRIPDNGGIEGLKLQWVLGTGLECAPEPRSNCDKLMRVSSGGGGDRTSPDGTSRLAVETSIEPGCPADMDRCRKGKVIQRTTWATVTPDLTTTPPVKLADLIFKPSSLTEGTARALAKVLVDVVTDMVSSLSTAKGTQVVERHLARDYRVRGTFAQGRTISGVKCGGYEGPWELKLTASKGPRTESGTYTFSLDEDGRGSLAFNDTVTVAYGDVSSKVVYTGTADVRLVETDDPEATEARLELANWKGRADYSGTGGNRSYEIGFGSGIRLEVGSFCGS